MRRWLIGILSAVILFGLGYGMHGFMAGGPAPSSQDYPLLAPRLFLEKPSDIRINFSPLRSQLMPNLRGVFILNTCPQAHLCALTLMLAIAQLHS